MVIGYIAFNKATGEFLESHHFNNLVFKVRSVSLASIRKTKKAIQNLINTNEIDTSGFKVKTIKI